MGFTGSITFTKFTNITRVASFYKCGSISTFLDVLVCMEFPNGITEKCKKGKVKSFAQKSGVSTSKYQKRSHNVGTPAGEAVRAPEAVQGNGAAS